MDLSWSNIKSRIAGVKQTVIGLKGLLIAVGPTLIALGPTLGYEPSQIEKWIGTATTVIGLVLVVMEKSSTTIIGDAASLPPEKQVQALANISDANKITIAEAVPGVATVVVKDNAPKELKEIARGPNPNIVTESQNEADAKLGNKVDVSSLMPPDLQNNS